jgi:glutamyl-Q tRNA(Asp) synthetase
VEDLDAPRTIPGAETAILRTLESAGLFWDGPVVRQSSRTALYRECFDRLSKMGRVFPCGCTRREIADSVAAPPESGEVPYPGTCRGGLPAGREARSWRLRVDEVQVTFQDRILGSVQQALRAESGDFILWRADGLIAYQLAVVADDADQQITDVVRGADLLASTPRQIFLQHLLGYTQPSHAHHPVATAHDGRKLSKQNQAPALQPATAGVALEMAFEFLGHPAPVELRSAPARELLDWAVAHWDIDRVPKVRSRVPAPPPASV